MKDTPFVLADLYMIPKILDHEHGPQATYKTQDMTDKSDSDSIEKVEHHKMEEAKETKSAEKDEGAVPDSEEPAAVSKKTAEKPTTAPLRVHHGAEGIPARSAVRLRSPSVGGSHSLICAPASKAKSRSQVAEVPNQQVKSGVKAQNRNGLKGALARSKADEAER